jgi:hypothetical protein
MQQPGRVAFTRLVRCALVAVALAVGVRGLWAQGTTGKIEGSVNDPSGQSVAGAQVLILGTSLGATTNAAGYYFINNVPAGVYSLRAQFIGFSPNEVRNVRVPAEQTVTVNFDLQRALELGAITVTEQQNPIVPRDQVSTKSIVTGDLVNDMPVDNIRDVLSLQPGWSSPGRARACPSVAAARVRRRSTWTARWCAASSAAARAAISGPTRWRRPRSRPAPSAPSSARPSPASSRS